MFGNPYKKDKHMVMVDEADLGEVMMKPNANPMAKKAVEVINRTRKRKAGPIRKDYVFRRLSTDSFTSMSSDSSDIDDNRSISDTSSNISDSDENELTIDLGFNQPSAVEQDFMVNGHVQSFINGENSDDSEDAIMQTHSPIHQHIIGNQINPPNTNTSPLVSPILLNASYTMNQQITASAPAQASIVSIGQSYPSPLSQQNGSQAAPTVQTHAQAHNDLNDAQEISKILQQCHNGASSNSSSSSNNNYGNNISISNNVSSPISHGNTNSNGNSGILFEPIIAASYLNQKSVARIDRDTTARSDSEAQSILFTTTTHVTQINHTNNVHDAPSNTPGNVITDSEEASVHLAEENDEELIETIKLSNLQARKIIFQDIRRPGRDYSQLLEHLSLIKGDLETKLQFIQMCIEESQRFRRKKMADCIQEWWDKYVDRTNNFNSIEFAT